MGNEARTKRSNGAAWSFFLYDLSRAFSWRMPSGFGRMPVWFRGFREESQKTAGPGGRHQAAIDDSGRAARLMTFERDLKRRTEALSELAGRVREHCSARMNATGGQTSRLTESGREAILAFPSIESKSGAWSAIKTEASTRHTARKDKGAFEVKAGWKGEPEEGCSPRV
jgi:hypothetical protein